MKESSIVNSNSMSTNQMEKKRIINGEIGIQRADLDLIIELKKLNNGTNRRT